MHWAQRLVTPPVADDQLRRQGILVIIISAVLVVLATILSLHALLAGLFDTTTVVTLSCIVLYVSCIAMARSGRIRPAAHLIAGAVLAGLIAAMIISPSPMIACFLAIPILLAGVLISGRSIILFALPGLLAIMLVTSRASALESSNYFTVTFFILTVSVLAFLSSWNVERALKTALTVGRNLEQANGALNKSNSALEERVAQRTSALEEALKDLREREAELQGTLSELRRSQEAVSELSAPILPVAPGVLVAPLIGAIDSARITLLLTSLLAAAERERARHLILDVTGAPVIDTQVARALLEAAQSLRLLGTQTLITGIRPEIAQTLVSLGVNLSAITTRATLQDGITEAVRRLPVQIGAAGRG